MIALETYIHRDLRRHWNHSTPRAKNTCSRTEMASGRQGLLQSIDMVIGYLKHLKEHIWNRCWHFEIRRFHIENIQITDLKKISRPGHTLLHSLKVVELSSQASMDSGICCDPFVTYFTYLYYLPCFRKPWTPLLWLNSGLATYSRDSLIILLKAFKSLIFPVEIILYHGVGKVR